MVETYLLPENGSSTSARTPHSWQDEHKYSIAEQNNNTSQDDDDVQIISWEVMAGSNRQNQNLDLNKSIFELPNDNNGKFVNRNGVAMDNNAVHLLSNYRTPHTITSGQLEHDKNLALPNQFLQTLPQISVANFAKEENVLNICNNANDATLKDDDDWLNAAKAVNPVNVVKIENLNDILDDRDWLNATNGNKKQIQYQISNIFDFDRNQTDLDTILGNGVTKRLPKTTEAAPTTSTVTANDWDDISGVINLPKQPKPNTYFEPNNPQPVPSTSNFNWHLPYAGAANNNVPAQDAATNKPNPNHQIQNNLAFYGQPLQTFPPVQPPLQPAAQPTSSAMAHPTHIAHPRIQQVNNSSLMDQMNYANMVTNTTNIDAQQNQPGPGGMTNQIDWYHQYQQEPQANAAQLQANAAQLLHRQWHANGMQPVPNNIPGQPVNYTPNIPMAPPPTMKRKHIPIKIVRSTQQYQTLLEMGFLRKEIEMALRKCNLDLHETIEYLSESKHAAKRRKKDQHTPDQFIAEIPNQVNILNWKQFFFRAVRLCRRVL